MFKGMAIPFMVFMVGGLGRDIRQDSTYTINTNNFASELQLRGCNLALFSPKPEKRRRVCQMSVDALTVKTNNTTDI